MAKICFCHSDFEVKTALKGSNLIKFYGPIVLSLVPKEIRCTDFPGKIKNTITRWKTNNCPCHVCKNYISNIRFLKIFE